MRVEPFWIEVKEPALRQGDYLPDCVLPVAQSVLLGTQETTTFTADLVILTQSCDLEQRRVRHAACCPIFALADFEVENPAFSRKGRWNEVLKGRFEGLHLLASPTNPDNNREALVVDFREIYSLPFDYLTERAIALGHRWRLRSPYLEHFSQAFARFFMRVGLPSTIPAFV